MKLYREFDDQAQLDAEYDVFAPEDDPLGLLAKHVALSNEVRAAQELRPHIPYGLTRPEYLDVYPAADPHAPVVVFFHGGWWTIPNTAEDHGLVAKGLVARGVTTVIVNYTLAPVASIDEIVRQARAAVVWTYRNIASHHGDPERIYVAGHSAGGQIVGMLALTDWEEAYGLPGELVKGGVPLSGLFDLNPFLYSWLAPKLLLSTETIRRQSPILNIRRVGVPLVIAYGGLESAEFHRQSAEFADAWRRAGNPGWLVELASETHLTVYATYAEASSCLTDLTVDLIFAGLGHIPDGLTVIEPTGVERWIAKERIASHIQSRTQE